MWNHTNNAARRRAALRMDQLRMQAEKRATRALSREFNRVARGAARNYAQSQDLSATLLATEGHHERIKEILQRIYRMTIPTTAAMVADEAPKSFVGRIERKDLQGEIDRLLAAWILDFAIERAGEIASTTSNRIGQVIASSTAANLPVADIARNINTGIGGPVGAARSQTIARTESHTSAQQSSLETAETLASGRAVVKRWVPVEDHRTRPTHIETSPGGFNGQIRPLDQPFSANGVRMMYPGDPMGGPAETINCRCVMVYEEQAL